MSKNKRQDGDSPQEERILRRIPREIIITSAIVAIASLLFFTAVTSLFILVGGIFSALTFFWLNQSLANVLLRRKKEALKAGIILYLVRLLLILAVFFIIIFFFQKKIVAFIAGFSTVILVFLAEAIIAFSRLKQWKD